MSRISLVGRSTAAGAAREAFERKIAERGNIPNMYRAFGHRPWLLTTMDAHFAAVMGSGNVPMKLKEMLALQTSLENECRYCAASHTELAERTGASPAQIASLLEFEAGPFTDKEKAALRFGLQMTRDSNRIPHAAFAGRQKLPAQPRVGASARRVSRLVPLISNPVSPGPRFATRVSCGAGPPAPRHSSRFCQALRDRPVFDR